MKGTNIEGPDSVTLPWLFNVYMDWVMKEVREKIGDVGMSVG